MTMTDTPANPTRRWKIVSDRKVMKAVNRTATEPLTRANVLQQADLDWEVKKSPVSYFTEHGGHELPGKSVVYRADTGQGFETVGTSSYQIVGNAALADLAFQVLEQSAEPIDVHSAGYFGIGQRVFFELRFPTDLAVSGDEFRSSLFVSSRHDGSGGVSVSLLRHRLACTNQLPYIFKGDRMTGGLRVTLRHTASIESKLAQVREALTIVPKVNAEFEAAVRALIDTPVSPADTGVLLSRVFPDGENDKTKAVAEGRRAAVASMARNDHRVGFTGTAWGLMQAVSTWEQHEIGDAPRTERFAKATVNAIDGTESPRLRLLGQLVSA